MRRQKRAGKEKKSVPVQSISTEYNVGHNELEIICHESQLRQHDCAKVWEENKEENSRRENRESHYKREMQKERVL